jgi:hypothetical protein
MVPKKAHDEREKDNVENQDQGEGDPGEPLVPNETGLSFCRLLPLASVRPGWGCGAARFTV